MLGSVYTFLFHESFVYAVCRNSRQYYFVDTFYFEMVVCLYFIMIHWFRPMHLFYLSVIKIFNARICHYYLHLCCYFHLHLPFVTMFCILAIILMSTYHHYMMDLTFVSVFLQVLQLRKCNGSLYRPVKGF